MEEYNLLCWAKLHYSEEDINDEELINAIKGVMGKSGQVLARRYVERYTKFFSTGHTEIEEETTAIRNPEDLTSFVEHTRRIDIKHLVSWSVSIEDVKSLEEAIKWTREVFSVRARRSDVVFYFRFPDNKETIVLSDCVLGFSKLKIEKTRNPTLYLKFNLAGFRKLWAKMHDSFIKEYIQELIDNLLLRAGSIAKALLKEGEFLMLDIFYDINGIINPNRPDGWIRVNWSESKVIRADNKEKKQIGEAIKTSVKQILEETNILDTRYFLQRKTAEYLPLFKL